MGEYFRNMETGKLEMHFDKSEYMTLTEEQKKEIKSNFLFSRYSSAWISRSKFPNLYYAEKVAQSLGLDNAGKQGERLTFEEQQERKAERAEARADRMEYRAEAAERKGAALQKPINDMHGDIAFFTQPNINTSSGRAFTRKRNQMWSAWERGMEEFKKSEYYQHRAEVARQTAKETRPTDKGFCQRRIDEANKTIRAQEKNIKGYRDTLAKIENGEEVKRWNGDLITAEEANGWIENAEEIMEQAIEKVIYYQTCIDDLGGVQFSKANIKPGYIVKVKRWGIVEVVSAGTKNIKHRALTDGWTLESSYAEIIEIVEAKEKTEIDHPFVVGESFTVKEWIGGEYVDKTYTVTKITPEKVTVKSGNERAKAIKPRRGMGYCKDEWYLTLNDGYRGYVTKKATA